MPVPPNGDGGATAVQAIGLPMWSYLTLGAAAPTPTATAAGLYQKATVAAGAGVTAVRTGPSRLRSATVIEAGSGTGPVYFYDSAGAASGTVIGALDAGSAAGVFVRFDMPAALGIVVSGPAGAPALALNLMD